MFNKIYQNKSFQNALPWIILIIGGLCGIYSIFFAPIENNWSKLSSLIASSFLAGGVFAVILKSMQFMGIFKDELVKVIYEPKFLQNRHDLVELWEKISKVLFQEKFSNISKKVLKDVNEIYLPTKEVSYYENAEHNMEFKIIDKANKIIEIIDTTTLDIISESKSAKTKYEFGISKDPNMDFKLISLVIDGNSNCKTTTVTKQFNETTFETKIVNLSGKDKYRVERKMSFRFDLKEDPICSFHAKKLFNKLKIQLHFENGINIQFRKSGTLSHFIQKKKQNNYIEYYNDGLVYKEQGYFLVLDIK